MTCLGFARLEAFMPKSRPGSTSATGRVFQIGICAASAVIGRLPANRQEEMNWNKRSEAVSCLSPKRTFNCSLAVLLGRFKHLRENTFLKDGYSST